MSRYLKNIATGQIVEVLVEDGHVANGHALEDGVSIDADPAAGWEDSTLAAYEAATTAGLATAAEALENQTAARRSAGAKLAALGLTVAERAALGLA